MLYANRTVVGTALERRNDIELLDITLVIADDVEEVMPEVLDLIGSDTIHAEALVTTKSEDKIETGGVLSNLIESKSIHPSELANALKPLRPT